MMFPDEISVYAADRDSRGSALIAIIRCVRQILQLRRPAVSARCLSVIDEVRNFGAA